MTKTIQKVLIANRGEIALRIQRTCQEMGIQTVAVYSEADREALFVRNADEAYEIGPAPSTESYLKVETLLEVAATSGADAIHPGYGFLSEKAGFSESCDKAGLVFIGPKPDAIRAMGDKIAAREAAEKAGVPTVPGTPDPIEDFKKAKALAKDMGYPVLLKAAAGGGGKGMRVVREEGEFEDAFQRAQSEAEQSFQDGRVYLEKYIENPHHVEVQVLCDAHGQRYFLYERECSTQRRHQKIIEEAPCAYLKDDVRAKMAEASLALCEAVNYLGVGTIEYLVDADQNFYFLEMNTRLQVEHTVTEEILGLDLVEQQLRVARGEKLDLKQEDIQPRGHSLQCRMYAEDPRQNFMPSPGRITHFQIPQGPGVRHDSGVAEGSEIPIYYDPMVSKLITWAPTREQAIQRMVRALHEFELLGVAHNADFLLQILVSEDFKNNKIHTQYLETRVNDFLAEPQEGEFYEAALVACALNFHQAGTAAAPTQHATNADTSQSLWWQWGGQS